MSILNLLNSFIKSIYHKLLKAYWRFSQNTFKGDVVGIQPKASTDKEDYLNQIALEYDVAKASGFIEPQTGWFLQGRTIVAESYPYWTNVPQGWPPLPSLLGFLNPLKRCIQVEKAVSFHYGWDNYYHFFIDTLPQIKFCQAYGDPTVVWIIPAKAMEMKYVQDYLAFDNVFENRQVIFQPNDTYVRITKEAHFVKRSRFNNAELMGVIRLLQSKVDAPQGEERIFLTRRGYRSLSNAPEIETIAESHGFRIVDTNGMSLVEQIRLFAQTRYLIGIHGAGLANMLFRYGKPLSVFELFPANKIPAHYWQLAQGMGFNYSFLIGGAHGMNETFALVPEQFSAAINRMIKEDPNLPL